MTSFALTTGDRCEMIDITDRVATLVGQSGIREGICHVFVPHTTAAVTINEKADPDVQRDILASLERMAPFDDGYRHAEGNSAAHIKATLCGSSQAVLVEGGRLVLGTWQALFFCEFDGPRTRRVLVGVTGMIQVRSGAQDPPPACVG